MNGVLSSRSKELSMDNSTAGSFTLFTNLRVFPTKDIKTIIVFPLHTYKNKKDPKEDRLVPRVIVMFCRETLNEFKNS
ncbi:hypothetical protein GCM10008932_23320 [Alkalibacterium iburiense]|uniref:Uncharacterized protein n=1 Tax=Alkalibacterium iburiense TaxID=290589 RepID=A0ABN0XSN6_9LACT